MGQLIISSDAQQFNNFTQSRQAYEFTMKLGEATAESTPVIDPLDDTTYRFAIRMPSIGLLQKVKVAFRTKSAGPDESYVDFRLFSVPWDAPDRDVNFDMIYEKRGIGFGTVWSDNLVVAPVPFANRISYQGLDPDGEEVTYSRNFLWMETKPIGVGLTDPTFWVQLHFEV